MPIAAAGKAPAIFTRDNLALALRIKTHAAGVVASWRGIEPTAEEAADAIRANGLEEVVAGRHDGKAVTFARGFELVFGERLTAGRK